MSCQNRPWYGFPGKIESACDVHKHQDMVSLSSRKCFVSSCNAVGVFGSFILRTCGIHASKSWMACFSCGTMEQCYREQRSMVDVRYCKHCVNMPIKPETSVHTLMFLEGVTSVPCLEFTTFTGIFVKIRVGSDMTREMRCPDIMRESVAAHTRKHAMIIILYNDTMYTTGKYVSSSHKRHVALMFVVEACMRLPYPDDINMFRTVRVFYDGFIGNRIPFKSFIKFE